MLNKRENFTGKRLSKLKRNRMFKIKHFYSSPTFSSFTCFIEGKTL